MKDDVIATGKGPVKQRQVVIDKFTLRYILFLAIALLLYATYLIVLDRHSIWGDLIFALAMIFALGFFIQRLNEKRWREAVSVAVALPVCLLANMLFKQLGIDGSQFAFWLTYPYYAAKVHEGQPTQFTWAEDGVFLGGGWINKLIYDPSDKEWNNIRFVDVAPKYAALGLGQRQVVLLSSSSDDCDYHTIKSLGGAWYFLQEMYAMDLCQNP